MTFRAIFLCLPVLALVLVASVLPAKAQPMPQTGALTDAEILHLLNRVSFGPVPGDIEAVRAMGINNYLDQQLHPERLPQSPLLTQRLSELPSLTLSLADLANQYDMPGEQEKALSPEDHKQLERRRNLIVEELSQAKVLRGILSPAQLQEVMTDFWFNHFNVFAQKGLDRIFIGGYERDAIRPYALGKFKDLLSATAHHPAMLVYLDNAQNTDPNSLVGIRSAQRGKEVGINENYAREVMELHTLGVDGGYSQQDVTTLAHILTGFGLSEGQGPAARSSFFFEPKRHDFANQVWLGYQVRGGGDEEIEQVLAVLAAHPSTARHISYELAQYFVADNPPSSLVDRMAASFHTYDGDISQVLLTMFRSPEFWDPHYTMQKFKPPLRFVISSLRAANVIPPADTRLLQNVVREMGEPLYHCLTPNGYANTNDLWFNSDALLKRIDFDKKLSGYLDNSSARAVFEALGSNWSQNTINTTRNGDPKLQAALLLSSPEFVYY